MYKEITSLMVHEWRKLIICNFETGNAIWINPQSRRVKRFSIAGGVNRYGYVSLRILGEPFLLHRVLWAMRHGYLSGSNQIDHVNCERSDNRMCNLRIASNSENMMNTKLRSTNTSGFKGVWFDKQQSLWIAEIWKDGVKHRVGKFSSAEEASRHLESVRKKYHRNFSRSN